jgi:hypothetical protein
MGIDGFPTYLDLHDCGSGSSLAPRSLMEVDGSWVIVVVAEVLGSLFVTVRVATRGTGLVKVGFVVVKTRSSLLQI